MIDPIFNRTLPASVRWNIARAYGQAIKVETQDATLGTAGALGYTYGVAETNVKTASTAVKVIGGVALVFVGIWAAKKLLD